MAKSKIGGAFGYLKGSIGSVTYTTQKLGVQRVRTQVARQKIVEMRNPNTTGQILQRMKLGPAQRFYAAFESVVEKGIMSHSYEGIQYGEASRQRFMQLAMEGEPKVYVPKGITGLVPGQYQISEGSLAGLGFKGDITEDMLASVLFTTTSPLSQDNVSALLGLGLELGDQISIVAVRVSGNSYEPAVARVNVGVGNSFQKSNFANVDIALGGVGGNDSGIYARLENGLVSDIAALAFVVSRGSDAITAKRSSESMVLIGDYKNLLSADAMAAAIASYKDGVEYNSFNSDWYLNNATSQAFNGRVQWVDVIVSGDGDLETDDSFLVGLQQTNGALSAVIFTTDGTANGGAFIVSDDNVVVPAVFSDKATPVKGSNLYNGLIKGGYSVSGYQLMSAAIAEQGGFTFQTRA